jgi:hypothetical protein
MNHMNPEAAAYLGERRRMNTITVTAHGTPESFVRRVQHDPYIAFELLSELKALVATAASTVELIGDSFPRASKDLAAETARANRLLQRYAVDKSSEEKGI